MGIVEGAILAISAIGTALTVRSQQKQADQADAIASQQEQTAREDAQFALSEAQLQAKAIRKAADKQRAEARGALAASGVVVGVGTAEQIDQEIQAGGEEDALMAIYDGSNRARSIGQQGEIASSRSRNAASAARYGAATSALQGGAPGRRDSGPRVDHERGKGIQMINCESLALGLDVLRVLLQWPDRGPCYCLHEAAGE